MRYPKNGFVLQVISIPFCEASLIILNPKPRPVQLEKEMREEANLLDGKLIAGLLLFKGLSLV